VNLVDTSAGGQPENSRENPEKKSIANSPSQFPTRSLHLADAGNPYRTDQQFVKKEDNV